MTPQLTIGTDYIVRTADSMTAVCLAKVNEERYLFAIPDNKATPFVSWLVYQAIGAINRDIIDCGHGNYYKDLITALKKEDLICTQATCQLEE